LSDTQIQPDTQPAHEGAAGPSSAQVNRLKADLIITRHVAVAAGAGLIPVPVVDFAAISGVQLSMLAQLCGVWEQPFSKQAATSVITSLAAGAAGGEISALTLGSRLKAVPVVGTVASWLVTPAASAVLTYAIGKVFVKHLESGGTLLSFDAKKMKDYMEKAVTEGKKLVPHWGTPAAAAAPDPAASA